jgi:hypothetical protein
MLCSSPDRAVKYEPQWSISSQANIARPGRARTSLRTPHGEAAPVPLALTHRNTTREVRG